MTRRTDTNVCPLAAFALCVGLGNGLGHWEPHCNRPVSFVEPDIIAHHIGNLYSS